jgi:beta-phosphoglucomutase-like phosphatase (HAD superfamily)
MTEPLQLVILDCDGVLVDSERLAVRVEAAVLAELGWPQSQAEVIERGRCCSTTCAPSPTCSPTGSQRRTRCATMPEDLARPATATRRTRPWRR